MAGRLLHTAPRAFGRQYGIASVVRTGGVWEFAEAPLVYRLGTPTSPRLDHVRHRLLPNASSRDVDVYEEDDEIYVSGSMEVTQSSDLHIAGVSALEGHLLPFALAAALDQPHKAAIWALKAGTPIPAQLVVRRDPREASHVLWAPRTRMSLREYQAALSSVGRDARGALQDWTHCTDLPALVASLPQTTEDQQTLMADAQELVSMRRRRPSTPAAFLARALLGLSFTSVDAVPDIEFLEDFTTLAAALPGDAATYASFAGSCLQLNEQLAGARLPLSPVHGAAAITAGKPGCSTPAAPPRIRVRVLAHFMGGVPGLKPAELGFVRDALTAARRELVLSFSELRDLKDEEYDIALDAVEMQFALGRAAARDLGFTDLYF